MTSAPTSAPTPDCPACGAALEPRGMRLFCDACRGVMVTSDELRQMLREIHPKEKRSLEQQLVPLAVADADARTCPHCNARMDAFSLNRVPIDQCFTHGFWFDRDELAKVLQGNTSPEQFEAENEDRQLMSHDFVAGSAVALVRKIYYWLRRKRQDAAIRAKSPAPDRPTPAPPFLAGSVEIPVGSVGILGFRWISGPVEFR
jgi:Zn-finger nucleic acid-binding protein